MNLVSICALWFESHAGSRVSLQIAALPDYNQEMEQYISLQ